MTAKTGCATAPPLADPDKPARNPTPARRNCKHSDHQTQNCGFFEVSSRRRTSSTRSRWHGITVIGRSSAAFAENARASAAQEAGGRSSQYPVVATKRSSRAIPEPSRPADGADPTPRHAPPARKKARPGHAASARTSGRPAASSIPPDWFCLDNLNLADGAERCRASPLDGRAIPLLLSVLQLPHETRLTLSEFRFREAQWANPSILEFAVSQENRDNASLSPPLPGGRGCMGCEIGGSGW